MLLFQAIYLQNEWVGFFSVVHLKVGIKAEAFSELKGWLSPERIKKDRERERKRKQEIASDSHVRIGRFVIVLSPECRFDRQYNSRIARNIQWIALIMLQYMLSTRNISEQ